MSPSPADRKSESGFTLIELLIVIAIIAILMSLLFPVTNAVKNSARKSQARNDLVTLKNAVVAYYNDYGKYPLNPTNANAGGMDPGWDTCYGDPGGLYSTADLCDILRGIADTRFNVNNQLNPRNVAYFEPALAKGTLTNPRGGLVGSTNGVNGPTGKPIPYGAYVDPWGMEYVVFIDANYDNTLSATHSSATPAISWFYYQNTPSVNCGVAACSLGPDSQWGTAGNGVFQGSDDIATWQ